MAGTFWINLGMGFVAFLSTLAMALSENVFGVSLERAVYAFLIFFLLSYPLRWFLAVILQNKSGADETGHHVDLVTPQDAPVADQKEPDAAPVVEADEPSDTFAPLVAPRIEGKDATTDSENIANVMRRFTDD